jgi:hypothetical protein
MLASKQIPLWGVRGMKTDLNVTGDVAIREVLALFIVSLFKRFPVSLEQKWRKLDKSKPPLPK